MLPTDEDAPSRRRVATRSGHVVRSYHVVCGFCDHETPTAAANAREAWAEARGWGWRYTDAYGYICRTCLSDVFGR